MLTRKKPFLVLLILMLAGSGCGTAADQSIVRTKVAIEMQQTALGVQQSQATLAAQQQNQAPVEAQETAPAQAPDDQADQSLQQTQVALAVQQTGLAEDQLALTEAKTSTPVPPTRAPASSTPSGPMFTASQNTNCRQGDSRHYQNPSSVNTGQSVPILGKSKAHSGFNWWFVQTTDGSKCYVSSDIGVTTGDTSSVPDKPAPTLDSWQGVWEVDGGAIEIRRDGNTFEWSTDWSGCDYGSFDSTGTTMSSDESLSGEVTEYEPDGSGNCVPVNSFSYKIAFAPNANHNQFVGNIDGQPFCGSRNGEGLPNTCAGP
jgi:hypothetical protein